MKLINESVVSRSDNFAQKFKGVEWEYFFEFLKWQFIYSLVVLPAAFLFMNKESLSKVLLVSGGIGAIPVALSLATSEWSDIALKKAKNNAKYDSFVDEDSASSLATESLGDFSV